MLTGREAIDDCNRKEGEDGDKTSSHNQLIMIALDHLVATQEELRIELKTMSDPIHRHVLRILISKSMRLVHFLLLRFLALQKWHAQYALTTMKRLITRRISTTLSRPTTYHQQNTLPIPTLNIKSRCTSFKLPMCYLMIFTKTHISRMEDDFHPIFS